MAYPIDAVKYFVVTSYGYKKTSMDSHEACYELQMLERHRTQRQQPSCCNFTWKIEHLPPKAVLQQLQQLSNLNAWDIIV